MADLFQIAGAQGSASDYAPLHVNRMITGYWTNTSPLRDAATTEFIEKFYGGRQDRIAAGVNAEISSRLTLRRRPGLSVYNSQDFPPITRWYGWNTFTLTSESVRVMADTATNVYDATGPNTKINIWSKSPGAGSTYFLGVGNTLYMTNGVENIQYNNETGEVSQWGFDAPTTAPTVSQQARPNPYPLWQASTFYSPNQPFSLAIYVPTPEVGFPVLEQVTGFGTTGATEPVWTGSTVQADGSVTWEPVFSAVWNAGTDYQVGWAAAGTVAGVRHLFYCVQPGTSGASEPEWVAGAGTLTPDGSVTWQDYGVLLQWSDIGADTLILDAPTIVDSNGYLQTLVQPGRSGATAPTWQTVPGAYTADGTVTWLNAGPYSVAATDSAQYGYAYQNSSNTDLSGMSPPSVPITTTKGGQVVVQGVGTGQTGVDTIPIYRTAQGGSIFFYRDEVPNPGEGQIWTYIDTSASDDSVLNTEIQAQVLGEGTPLPVGATCLEYHVGRIFAAVGNVVYVSSGPDAIVAGSSGNAGFDTTFTAQSKITRFWVNALGVVVFTVRDAYIILGSGTPNDPLYMVKYIENLPLLNYDAFAIFLTTPYLYTGHRMVNALDPSAGILEASFPIADQVQNIDPKKAYVTFHSGPTGETALYVSDGATLWYRMAPTSAPESGLNWNPPAYLTGGTSAVQSVETLPGTMTLLIGPSENGPILQRDTTVNTDNGSAFQVYADVGNIVLAHSGELAGLAWITLESMGIGSGTKLFVMLDEINELTGSPSAQFYPVYRTHQDPPNAPPIQSYYSNRHNLLQNQKTVWCRSLKLRFEWPVEDAANELMTYTIFGQTWQEQRTQ